MMTTAHSVSSSEKSTPASLATLQLETLENFKQITKQYALFHICFFSLAFLELVCFILFFTFLTQTTVFAFSLATLFLTGFSYFVLLFYLSAKKPQQLLDIHAYFINGCKTINRSSLPSRREISIFSQCIRGFFKRIASTRI